MESLRTPDERFESLPDFPFAPHYVEFLLTRRPTGNPGRCACTTSTKARPTARSCC